jgi:hypothetical protein
LQALLGAHHIFHVSRIRVKWVIKLEEYKNNYLIVGTTQYNINMQFQVLPSLGAIKDVASCDYVIL